MAFIYLSSLLFTADSLSIPYACVVWIRYSGDFFLYILLFWIDAAAAAENVRRPEWDSHAYFVHKTETGKWRNGQSEHTTRK